MHGDLCPLVPSGGVIRDWHVLGSGFFQGLSRPTGLETLWQRLRRELGNCTVAIEMRPWDCDWDAFAEFVWRTSVPDPRIRYYGYSYGAGWGLPRFARALRRRGLEVERAVLSDPVYRHPLRLLTLLGLWGLRPITVPANVRDVWHFFQAQNWPRGHPLVAECSRATRIRPPHRVEADHQYMDDAPLFQDCCVMVARLKAPSQGRNREEEPV